MDAWGRKTGPAVSLPVTPKGSWENPNHYLWATNPHYDFYDLTIREYMRSLSKTLAE